MKLYDTLSKSLQNFRPLNPPLVKLYTCGPTVYDYAQLGNLRAFVFDDTLRRALLTYGFQVKHVMNITDVGHLTSDSDEGDDKLEKGAAREHKTVSEIVDYFISVYESDAKALDILPPNGYSGPHAPYARATDFIPEQIEIIKLLIEGGFAYTTNSAIYFDVTKLSDYGKLSGQNLTEKEVGARKEVVTDKSKKNPQDFALWFFKAGRFASHSQAWDSPWGEGFPGWHLECSAIIHATLGEPVDIHTGGVDHIGTHHTNEIAQTEAAFGTELAKFWLHNEFLLADGEKMSKSTGNYYTLKDVVGKGFEPLALRLLFLQTHYRSQMNFTWESLAAAQAFLKNLQAWADLKHQAAVAGASTKSQDYKASIETITHLLGDDLNTAGGLAVLAELISAAEADGAVLDGFQTFLDKIDLIFGLDLSRRPNIGEEIKALISQREQARQANDWQKSDELRAQLEKKGIEINDTSRGQIWRRI